MKTCARCRQKMPKTMFVSNGNGRGDGLHSWCKPCKAADNRRRRAEARKPRDGGYTPRPRKRHNESAQISKPRRHKLEASDIKLIRQLLAEGLSLSETARKFEVSAPTISDIKRRITWRHV